ncbi:DUF2141 domain-containing protein [Sphingomonas arenae]|uniref:DUF2141 domain-containing protein n=1 Tax=Sphingomonas arenae TaxID=2812555 RepID=UPI0019676A5E|nr:DUF2141 domain-containing protein [Sphingomonas arenae]
MSKLPFLALAATGLALPALLALAPVSAAVVGKDAAACNGGKPSLHVQVRGFKQAAGTVRVVLYGPDGYLQKGGSLRKVRVPVQSRDALDVCIAVPAPGTYAVAVHHDVDGDKQKDRTDGGGFSRNPRLSLTSLRPRFQATAVSVGSGPRVVPVQLQYLQGLRIGPVKG